MMDKCSEYCFFPHQKFTCLIFSNNMIKYNYVYVYTESLFKKATSKVLQFHASFQVTDQNTINMGTVHQTLCISIVI